MLERFADEQTLDEGAREVVAGRLRSMLDQAQRR
jgi:hypothetical protein